MFNKLSLLLLCYFILLYFILGKNPLHKYRFVHVKYVGYILKVSLRHHVCSCKLWTIICRNVYDLSWDCSVGIATGCRLDGQGFDSRQEQQIFPFSTASKQALGPAFYSVSTGGSLLVVKLPEREANQATPYSAEVKNPWSRYLHFLYVFVAWNSVNYQGNNFVQNRPTYFLYATSNCCQGESEVETTHIRYVVLYI
jgi:hypothetical protein